MIAFAAPPSPVWFFARSAGFISLVLLTISVSLGILFSLRRRSRTWPLFVTDELHRYATLVFFVFLVLHITTVLLDPFTKFNIIDVVVPFLSPYRRVWMGLGILAAELALALAISGWVRGHLGYRVFRILHYATYVILPLALVHGLATGSDTKSGWGLAVYVGCVLCVGGLTVVRLGENAPSWRPIRFPALAAGAAGIAVLVLWVADGPLASRWVQASGTPESLLTPAPTPSPSPPPTLALAQPFVDNVTGTVATSSSTELSASGSAEGTVPLTWVLHVLANQDQSIGGTLDVKKDGASICSATVSRLTDQGFVATCTPANATGTITLLLTLQQGSASQVSGQLQVSGANNAGG
jgi:sulfoxide reductase heme-binding subunit YedZ